MSDLIKLTDKLHLRSSDANKIYLFWCPACKQCHSVWTEQKNGKRPNWNYNGDANRPTFTPSIKLTAPPSDYCCHFFITDGKIAYCGDCNHDLKGKTVDMQPIPVDYAT